MSSNPLQDNGLPKYDWFQRVVAIIVSARTRGDIKLNDQDLRIISYRRQVKKDLRREIVRVAKDFVGRIKWGTQAGQHERRNLELVIESRQRIINGLREQLREARRDAGK